jgi:hypothetical protein
MMGAANDPMGNTLWGSADGHSSLFGEKTDQVNRGRRMSVGSRSAANVYTNEYS